MQQRHPQSSPGRPTQRRGSPGRYGTGSGTAGSHAHDGRSSSASCRSATSARAGTAASHIAEEADNENGNNTHFQSRFGNHCTCIPLISFSVHPDSSSHSPIWIPICIFSPAVEETYQVMCHGFLKQQRVTELGIQVERHVIYLLLWKTRRWRTQHWLNIETVHLNEEFRLLILKTGRLPLWTMKTREQEKGHEYINKQADMPKRQK